MAYDEDLAERVRGLLAERGETFDTKRMFGGLAFMVRGHMAVALGRGGMLVRAAPSHREKLIALGAEPAVMGSREMRGWLEVSIAQLGDDSTGEQQLSEWLDRSLAVVATLPAKRP